MINVGNSCAASYFGGTWDIILGFSDKKLKRTAFI